MISTGNENGVVNLSKGQVINLSKAKPGLKRAMIGLGWDCNKYDGGDDFDLDASVFCENASGRTPAEGFVFYNNLQGPNNAIIHQGDNRTGEGEGDDEQIMIDFDLIPSWVDRIAITVTIDSAEERKQNFGMVDNSFCRIVNMDTDTEEIRFDLGEDFSVETAVVVAEFYKKNNDWQFKAIGQGFAGGLKALCNNYGLQADYLG